MNRLIVRLLLFVPLAAQAMGQSTDPPTTQPATPQSATADAARPEASTPPRDQRWLKQLVGEWDVQFKMEMQMDQPPSTGVDSVRALGDQWILAEMKTSMMGTPYTGVMSLGYNELSKSFHGTWVDSFSGYLWVYKGTLNQAGDTLTLETEGPSIHTPNKMARYREVIRLQGPDRRTFTSSTEDEGSWKQIVTIEYRRKK